LSAPHLLAVKRNKPGSTTIKFKDSGLENFSIGRFSTVLAVVFWSTGVEQSLAKANDDDSAAQAESNSRHKGAKLYLIEYSYIHPFRFHTKLLQVWLFYD
jgi:hypothetical protein